MHLTTLLRPLDAPRAIWRRRKAASQRPVCSFCGYVISRGESYFIANTQGRACLKCEHETLPLLSQ